MEKLIYNPVQREDIKGNETVVNELERAVYMLMAHSKAGNPLFEKGFFNQRQRLLLEGEPRSGKTMIAAYGMTLADKIADQYAKDLEIAALDCISPYKGMGVKKLRSQFEEISRGDKIYYIFLNEIESMFPPEKHEEIKELQKFLDNGYPNKGNYLLVAETTNPKSIVPEVRNKFKMLHCEKSCD